MLLIWIILWSVLGLLFGTAGMAIRIASRTRLTELMKGRTGEQRLNRFFASQGEYARISLAYQLLCVILFVQTLIRSLQTATPEFWQPIYVLAIGLLWILIFEVGIPVAWARYAGDVYLARIIPLLEPIRKLSRPLLAVIRMVDEIVRRLAGAPTVVQDQSEQIEREIMDAVIHGETSGTVDPSEKAMIKSVMVLDETSAGEIMTPRTDMVGIDVHSNYQQVRELILTDGHSRIPVYEGSTDHIVGVLYAKDLLAITDAASFSLRDSMRKATFVPETKDLASLLREFQANRVHIAIVLDEYGGTAGLVTFEDIMEELVGEITDEHEIPPTPPFRRINEHTAEVDARMRVEELNEVLGITLPEDESYDTVGGFVFSKIGRIPTVGECVVEDGVKIEIIEAQERSIGRVQIHLIASATPQE